jgi:hypothetical protein
MAEDEESESSGMLDLGSKFWRTFMVILAVLLIFAGPTYVPYVMSLLQVGFFVSASVGLVLLVVGLLLLVYLIKKKVVL